MIIVNVKYHVTPGSRDKVLDYARQTRKIARTQPGNIEYCSMPSPDDDVVIGLEKWETIEDLRNYVATDCCKTFQKNRDAYLVEGSKITEIYEATPTAL